MSVGHIGGRIMTRHINKLWFESRCFKKFWKSYFYMVTHPKECLRMLNFATKVLVDYGIQIEKNGQIDITARRNEIAQRMKEDNTAEQIWKARMEG